MDLDIRWENLTHFLPQDKSTNRTQAFECDEHLDEPSTDVSQPTQLYILREDTWAVRNLSSGKSHIVGRGSPQSTAEKPSCQVDLFLWLNEMQGPRLNEAP